MSTPQIDNVNIRAHELLTTPDELKSSLPRTALVDQHVNASRNAVKAIIDGNDHRLVVVVGPCSIHDTNAALDYATKLKALSDEVSDTLLLVMRVYFEKPRTTVGWKGLINDPYLNGSFAIEDGMRIGRKLLLTIAEMGLPTGTEALDPISPQYLHDLISWTAIGARTTESQTHREMSSGLSTAVGFKNGTDGSLSVATNALLSVAHPHSFLGLDPSGRVCVIHTAGNAHAHIVLRGGDGKPNYDSVSVALCEQNLRQNQLPTNIMIDCSHANSNKDETLQPLVLNNITHQILDGNQSIFGVMLESNLNGGNQKIPLDHSEMQYGVSVTDACIDWETTSQHLLSMRDQLKSILPTRKRK
ncbi:MAG: 3-deoxy-7-phosphoheptulonate synthase [Gammaproteobacteria bacterium]